MAKSWTSLPRRLRCKDCDPEVMSATVPFATSSLLLPTVGLVSTDGPGLDSFDSDMMSKEVCEDAAVLRKSDCGMPEL
jgi:hypothetical protein